MSDAKAALRRALRAARRALPPAQARAEAAATCAALAAWLASHRPAAVAAYWALPEELDLGDLLAARWREGLPVWLPRVDGLALRWHPVTTAAQCTPGAYGIREPDDAAVPGAPLPPDALVIVPGIGFAADGRRLGQGGGFYDRFLPAHRGQAIGVGFACQRCEDIPIDGHDRHVDGVVLGGIWVMDVRRPTSDVRGRPGTSS